MSQWPEWALNETVAALRTGMTVPDAERRLVSKGLTPDVAAAVVNRVLEGALEQPSRSSNPGSGSQTLHFLAAVLVALVAAVLAFLYGGGESTARTFLWMLLPLAAIAFPSAMGRSESAGFVRLAAWIAMAAILVARIVLLAGAG